MILKTSSPNMKAAGILTLRLAYSFTYSAMDMKIISGAIAQNEHLDLVQHAEKEL